MYINIPSTETQALLCITPNESSPAYGCMPADPLRHLNRRLLLLLIRQMCINLQDHSLVGVPHPLHGGSHIHVRFPKHGDEGMSEVVRADMYFSLRRPHATGLDAATPTITWCSIFTLRSVISISHLVCDCYPFSTIQQSMHLIWQFRFLFVKLAHT